MSAPFHYLTLVKNLNIINTQKSTYFIKCFLSYIYISCLKVGIYPKVKKNILKTSENVSICNDNHKKRRKITFSPEIVCFKVMWYNI